MTTRNRIQERFERERAAHIEDDVLARSHQLKDRFPHNRNYRSLRMLLGEMDEHLSRAKGQRVLDLGCGNGERSLKLLEAGATVSGIDISSVYIDNCIRQAEDADFDAKQFDFQAMDAHNLQYEDGTFGMVIGNGILHHLDLEISTNEILRVLKPNGRAVFLEPLAANPLLKLFRLLTPRARTEDERPLSRADLQKFHGNAAWQVENLYCGLMEAPTAVATSILLRRFQNNIFLRGAHWLEKRANRVRFLQPMNQYVLLNLVRRDATD